MFILPEKIYRQGHKCTDINIGQAINLLFPLFFFFFFQFSSLCLPFTFVLVLSHHYLQLGGCFFGIDIPKPQQTLKILNFSYAFIY